MPSSPAILQASFQVLTSKPLFANIVDFIPGVPYFVFTFKKHFDKQLAAHPPAKRQRMEASSSGVPTPTLWPKAVSFGEQRVLSALHDLSKIDTYSQNPQLQFDDIVGYAANYIGDIEFLDWIYATFTEQHERNVTAVQSQGIVGESPFEVVQWIHEHNFPFTPGAMDVAALCGRFDVVQFLHAHGTEGCTKSAMDFAAVSGHLHIVRFLHEHRTEGCTVFAMSFAACAGHLDVLRFLHENRTEGCTSDTVASAAKQGHLQCIKYLHEHRVGGFGKESALDAATIEGHLETVQFLHGDLMGVL